MDCCTAITRSVISIHIDFIFFISRAFQVNHRLLYQLHMSLTDPQFSYKPIFIDMAPLLEALSNPCNAVAFTVWLLMLLLQAHDVLSVASQCKTDYDDGDSVASLLQILPGHIQDCEGEVFKEK